MEMVAQSNPGGLCAMHTLRTLTADGNELYLAPPTAVTATSSELRERGDRERRATQRGARRSSTSKLSVLVERPLDAGGCNRSSSGFDTMRLSYKPIAELPGAGENSAILDAGADRAHRPSDSIDASARRRELLNEGAGRNESVKAGPLEEGRANLDARAVEVRDNADPKPAIVAPFVIDTKVRRFSMKGQKVKLGSRARH